MGKKGCWTFFFGKKSTWKPSQVKNLILVKKKKNKQTQQDTDGRAHAVQLETRSVPLWWRNFQAQHFPWSCVFLWAKNAFEFRMEQEVWHMDMCICWLKEEPYLWVVKAIPRSLDNYLKYQYRNMSYSVKKYKYRCVYMMHYVFNIWKQHYIMMVCHLFSFAPSEIESQLVMVSRKFLSAQHG